MLGLVPGQPTTVPLVVVAEDGVTSLRYYVVISRAPAPARPPGASPAPAPGWPGWSAYPGAGLGADAGAPDAGAPAAVVAWRRAAPRAPTCPPCVAPPSRAVVAASTAARGQSHASCVMPQRAWGGPQLPDATACLGRL